MPIVEAAPEPITMAGVHAMIQAMMDEQREEMKQLLLNNRSEPSIPVEQPELNDGQSEEGNYSRTISQVEPTVAERNNLKKEVNRDERMYKNFLGTKPPSLPGSPKPVEIMD